MSYFNGELLPQPNHEYVCWVDIMGMRNELEESIVTSANYIFKLQANIIESKEPFSEIKVYPMMDGAYITCLNQQDMLTFLRRLFVITAQEFCNTTTIPYRFIIKASVSYGPIIHGCNVSTDTNDFFKDEGEKTKNEVLVGIPMAQAFNHEHDAPPFGIYIDESARAFSPNGNPISHRWWRWYCGEEKFVVENTVYDGKKIHALATMLKEKGNEYYDYMKKHTYESKYELDRIQEHEMYFNEYFDI